MFILWFSCGCLGILSLSWYFVVVLVFCRCLGLDLGLDLGLGLGLSPPWSCGFLVVV